MRLYEYLCESKGETKHPLKDAKKIAKELIEKIGLEYHDDIGGDTKGKEGWGVPAGSIRREKEMVGDIDIVVVKELNPDDIEKIKGVSNIYAKGRKQIFFDYKGFKINIWVATSENFGAMLFHSTGSSHHEVVMRMVSKKQGLLLNQYGIFRGDKRLGGETENSIFKNIKTKNHPKGKDFVLPKDRD